MLPRAILLHPHFWQKNHSGNTGIEGKYRLRPHAVIGIKEQQRPDGRLAWNQGKALRQPNPAISIAVSELELPGLAEVPVTDKGHGRPQGCRETAR